MHGTCMWTLVALCSLCVLCYCTAEEIDHDTADPPADATGLRELYWRLLGLARSKRRNKHHHGVDKGHSTPEALSADGNSAPEQARSLTALLATQHVRTATSAPHHRKRHHRRAEMVFTKHGDQVQLRIYDVEKVLRDLSAAK